MAEQLSPSRLHYRLIRHIIDAGYAPDNRALAAEFGVSENELVAVMQQLAGDHGLVLHPHAPEVWVIHPFSLAPTNFLVETAHGEWWSNCAWCALGAASLLGVDATIRTTLGANRRQVEVHVRDGDLVETDFWVHFPVPMQRAWDNVIYTCSTMLLFESEAEVDQWCDLHGIAKGNLQPISTVWEFAREWYGRHLDPDWQKWTAEEAAEIFKRYGLSGPIWELEGNGVRF
jgi:hypothetical protein